MQAAKGRRTKAVAVATSLGPGRGVIASSEGKGHFRVHVRQFLNLAMPITTLGVQFASGLNAGLSPFIALPEPLARRVYPNQFHHPVEETDVKVDTNPQ